MNPKSEPERKKPNYKGLIILSLSLFFALWTFVSSVEDSSKLSNADARTVIKTIQVLRDNGLLKSVDPSLNRAEIDLLTWNLLPLDAKEKSGKYIAYYCGIKKGTDIYRVDLYDRSSGRKIAKYSDTWGLEVY